MLSDLVDDDLLPGSLGLPSSMPMKNMLAMHTGSNSGGGSVLLMQPKLEPQQPVIFDQQQHQHQQQQSKMVPITPRYDPHQQCSTTPTTTSTYTCSNCTQPIHERYLLYTQDRLCRGNYWHMQCLRCQCCDAVLADISTTFYTKDNALLCKSDYIKRYGSRPCSSCGQVIGPSEQVMRVSPNYVYHLHCFSCVKCHARLVKGDRYVSFNGQLFCEKDNPLKSTTNSPASKRGTGTSKRGAKAATAAASRAAAAAAAAAQAQQQQQAFATSSAPMSHQYHHTGHITLMNNHHLHGQPSSSSTTNTHSLLNNLNTNPTSNGSSSLAAASGDELY